MAQILVRNLDDDVKRKLQRRALRHGRSMEEEARRILSSAVEGSEGEGFGWASRAASVFAAVGFTDEEATELELRGFPARPAEIE